MQSTEIFAIFANLNPTRYYSKHQKKPNHHQPVLRLLATRSMAVAMGSVAVAFAMFGLLLKMREVSAFMREGDEVGEDADAYHKVVQGLDAARVHVLALVVCHEIVEGALGLLAVQKWLDVRWDILHLHAAKTVEVLHCHSCDNQEERRWTCCEKEIFAYYPSYAFYIPSPPLFL